MNQIHQHAMPINFFHTWHNMPCPRCSAALPWLVSVPQGFPSFSRLWSLVFFMRSFSNKKQVGCQISHTCNESRNEFLCMYKLVSHPKEIWRNSSRAAVKCDRSCPQYEPTTEKNETLQPGSGLFGEQPQDGWEHSNNMVDVVSEQRFIIGSGFSPPALSTWRIRHTSKLKIFERMSLPKPPSSIMTCFFAQLGVEGISNKKIMCFLYS